MTSLADMISAARSFGFTKLSALTVLMTLHKAKEPATTHTLAEASGITVSGIHLILDDFQARKLITRTTHPFTGKRLSRLSPTGRAVAARIEAGDKA